MTSERFNTKPLLFCLMMIVLVALLVSHTIQPISPKGLSAPSSVFSAARAFEKIKYLTSEQVPHSVDTKANRLVEQRLIELLRSMGYQEQIQDEQHCQEYNYGRLRCTRVRNIIVKKDGTSKGKNGILLAAHYDSVPAGPGGSDAAAAVGTLLETARLLKQLDTIKNDVVFLFNEGEEFGLVGAKVFMQRHPLAKTLKLAINVEARGSTGQSVMFETGENSGWLVEQYFNSTPSPLSSSLFYEVYKFLPNDTDLTVFKEHELQGLNFAHAENEPHYHTPLDNLENLNLGSLQHHGDNVWGVLKTIVNQDLSTTAEGNLVYTDVLGTFDVHWQESSTLTITLALLSFLSVLIGILKNNKEIRLGKVSIAAFILLFVIVVSTLSAWFAQFSVQTLSSTSFQWRADQTAMMVTLWLFVITTGLVFSKVTLKSLESLEVFVGQLLLFTLLSLVSSLFMAGISFLFIIPSVLGCLFLLLGIIASKANVKGLMSYMACGQSLIVMVVFLPIVKVLEIMVSYSMSMAMGLFLGFVVIGLTPLLTLALESYRTLNRLLLAGGGACLILFAITTQQSAFSEHMPQGLNLIYVQKGQKAEVLTGASSQYPPQTLTKAFNSLELAQSLPWGSWMLHTGQVEHQDLKPLALEIIDNNLAEGSQTDIREVSLNIDDSDELMGVRLYIPVESDITSIAVGDDTFNIKGRKVTRNGYYEYLCRGIRCAKQTVTLKAAASSKTKILAVKVISGLPSAFSEKIKSRGKSAVPRQAGDQSFIISEIEI